MKKYQSSIGDRSKTKIYGFIPVRMKASRLPGKPLIKILNKTMLEHVFERAKMYKKWEIEKLKMRNWKIEIEINWLQY